MRCRTISSAALSRRAGKVLEQHRVEIDLGGDLPMLRLDPVLFEQVLFNLLDNAAKYAPDGCRDQHLGAKPRTARVRLRVIGRGRGHPG